MFRLKRVFAIEIERCRRCGGRLVSRLTTSGVRITAKDNAVTGRVFLKDGGYDDEVYEKTGPGHWRVKSSTHVAPGAR